MLVAYVFFVLWLFMLPVSITAILVSLLSSIYLVITLGKLHIVKNNVGNIFLKVLIPFFVFFGICFVFFIIGSLAYTAPEEVTV